MEIMGKIAFSSLYVGLADRDLDLYKAAISAQAVIGSLDIQRVIISRDILSKGKYG